MVGTTPCACGGHDGSDAGLRAAEHLAMLSPGSPSPGARVPGARVPVRQAPSMDWRVGGGGRGGWGHGGRGHPGDEGGERGQARPPGGVQGGARDAHRPVAPRPRRGVGQGEGGRPGVAPARDATRRAQGGGQAAGGQVRRAAGVHLQPRLRRGDSLGSPGTPGSTRDGGCRPVPNRQEPTRGRGRSRRRGAAMRLWPLARRDVRRGALAEGDQIGRGRG